MMRMRIFEVIRPEKSEVMARALVFCKLEHNSTKKWTEKGKNARIARENLVFQAQFKEAVAIFSKQWIRRIVKEWSNE